MKTERCVLITGVSRGLGRALAQRLVQLQQKVIGCARDGDALAALLPQLGGALQVEQLDVADWAQVHAWSQRLAARGVVPDVIVNNAALMNASAPLWQVPVAEFDAVVDVNIKGSVNVIRAFMPALLDRGSGVIVNMSSGWGRATAPDVAPYCATKWAIEGLTRALAQELPHGLAAVALNPGIIHTEMLESCFGREAARGYPEPEPWAEQAARLILDLGPGDSGTSLTV